MAPREGIPLDRRPDNSMKDYKIFRPRASEKVGNGEAKAWMEKLMQDVFDPRLRSYLSSATECPTMHVSYGGQYVIMGHFDKAAQIVISNDVNLYLSMAYQMLIPMMEGQLSSSELLVE